jgi:hypothetical protein
MRLFTAAVSNGVCQHGASSLSANSERSDRDGGNFERDGLKRPWRFR